MCNLPESAVTAVGESSVSDLKTRPDYSITVHKALVGFIELKAPGKGADPRKFKDPHDKEHWEKLRSLPNIIYTDGNSFSLWQNGELVGSILTLIGNIESSGAKLKAPLLTNKASDSKRSLRCSDPARLKPTSPSPIIAVLKSPQRV